VKTLIIVALALGLAYLIFFRNRVPSGGVSVVPDGTRAPDPNVATILGGGGSSSTTPAPSPSGVVRLPASSGLNAPVIPSTPIAPTVPLSPFAISLADSINSRTATSSGSVSRWGSLL
jgi:hypothetical protein